jgi:ATP-dependent Clp protease protease subunit
MSLPPELQAGLLGKRLIFVRGRLDETNANGVISQLLLLAQMDPARTIELYLDSPGGSLSAALSLYDVMHTVSAPVSTTCLGTVGGATVLPLAGGASGLRYALPNARIHLIDEQVEVAGGRGNDLASHADQAARLRARWREVLARYTAYSGPRLDRDLTAGQWLSAAEARDYGLVDGILPGRP